MATRRPIRWLHFSDLHMGCPGRGLWWQVQNDLQASLTAEVRQLGPPDLILLTGDLSNHGTADELRLVDDFLQRLLAWIADAAPQGAAAPLLLAIPGNHDVVRPQGTDVFAYRMLRDYGQGSDHPDVALLEKTLWEDRDPSFFKPLFAPYEAWLEHRIMPQLARAPGATLRRSHLPGDFSVDIEVPGTFPLTVVGLNSTWQQVLRGDFERHLVLPTRQFHAALGGDAGGRCSPLAPFESTRRALLLLHHPPAWLAPRGRQIFQQEIYAPGRFDLCLYGHLHLGRSEEISIGGNQRRAYFQAPSLFGLENFEGSGEARWIGYAWGSLSAEGTVRLWPRRHVVRGSGAGAFVHDHDFEEDPLGTVIAGPQPEVGVPNEAPAIAGVATDGVATDGVATDGVATDGVATDTSADFTAYLEDLVRRTGSISIRGIVRRVQGALIYPIEDLYIPLTSRGELSPGEGEEKADGLPLLLLRPERRPLAELLRRHRHLLIEGQPGAGKTTFLHLVACMLGRDLLGVPRPDGGTWRGHHLGLDGTANDADDGSQRTAPVPVLLRVSALVALLTDAKSEPLRDTNCHWLLDLLEKTSRANGHAIPMATWNQLLSQGDAVLLLDGLDEADDDRLRRRILDILDHACTQWPCRIVVTSRPFSTDPLRQLGFHQASIEAFDTAAVAAFVDRWLEALHGDGPSGSLTATEPREDRDSLMRALSTRSRVRRLAANPVMLTCLCVVHWNEGRLPDGRAQVYQAVLDWLIRARSPLREQAGFSDGFAERAFARLALAMMDTEGKRAEVDFEEAVLAVEPLLRRAQPGSTAEDRRHLARRWLDFECLGSGIIEEVARRRLRFWHLTFQEFLAALQLAWRGDGESPEEDWWPIVQPRLDDAQWRESIEMLPGCLLQQGGIGRVDRRTRHQTSSGSPSPGFGRGG